MSFAQKDCLNRIQHILLPTTKKIFHRKREKNADFRYNFSAVTTYSTTQWHKLLVKINSKHNFPACSFLGIRNANVISIKNSKNNQKLVDA